MQPQHRTRLNDSGEQGIVRIFGQGALHFSQGQNTTWHAHYAWKVHIGIDAPVWIQTDNTTNQAPEQARVLVVPPGIAHSTGAVGWSAALFLAPGSRGLPWRATTGVQALQGQAALKVIDQWRSFNVTERSSTADWAAAVGQSLLGATTASTVDPRVEAALRHLRQTSGAKLPTLARGVGLSLDRLSRLTIRDTGLSLREHVLWTRLTNVLAPTERHRSLAHTAIAAGFSDHAHLTRTFRRFLGRAPSDFVTPPDAIAPW